MQMPTSPAAQTKTITAPVVAATPAFVSSWTSAGSTSLINPQGIALDANGNIYVTDLYLAKVVKYDANGTLLADWGSRSGVTLSEPTGIAVQNGNIFVADSSNARVVEFDANGNFVAQVNPTDTDGSPLFVYPTGVSFDKQGNLYVSDNSDEVYQFNNSLQLTGQWGTGSTQGIFDYPVVSAEDGFGNIYVANNNSDRITKLTPSTNAISTWGTFGTQQGQFDGPVDLKLDASGNVYVVDTGNNRIQEFTASGAFLSQFGADSNNVQGLNGPTGMAIDGNGNIYVVDNGNARIVKYSTK